MASGLLYDAVMRPLDWLGLERARSRLVAGLEGRVLELGAGTGLLFEHYGLEARPVGVDVDLEGLRRARARSGATPLVCADAQALPFPDDTFDAVVESLVLCSVPDVRQTLAEARRVLRTGGELRLLDHVRPAGSVLGRLADAVTPFWAKLSGGCHLNRAPARELGSAGFDVVWRRRSGRGLGDELRARGQDARAR
ncbi:MAG: hypothetical protein NVSMB25_26400 [Thermoleophilaceae bacterium]